MLNEGNLEGCGDLWQWTLGSVGKGFFKEAVYSFGGGGEGRE